MFDRRINRLGFILGYFYALAIPILLSLLQAVGHSFDKNGSSGGLTAAINLISVILGVCVVIIIIPVVISLYVRRLHDVNQSGWWTLLVLIPFVNLLLLLYALFAPGTKGANKYGPPISSYSYFVVLGFKQP